MSQALRIVTSMRPTFAAGLEPKSFIISASLQKVQQKKCGVRETFRVFFRVVLQRIMPPKNLTPSGKKTANVSPAYSKIIEEFRRPKQARSLDQYYSDWNKIAKNLDSEDSEKQLNELIKNIKPNDLGFTLGPAMTEEQFKEYRSSSGPRFSDMYNSYHDTKKDDK